MNRPLNPWNLPGYKAGQNVACKIVGSEPGGYAVHIPKDNLRGFLPTEQKLKVGEEVLAQFVCINNNRILLSARFSSVSRDQTQTQTIRWQDQMEAAAKAPPSNGENSADAAFQVWANANPGKFHLRRAVDLLMPPLAGQAPKTFKIGDYDLEWLITDLEGGMRTGCVKASSKERLSRSAMLVYRGRAVGCIYGCKTLSDAQPTEPSLCFMLKDLMLPSTEVSVYDLPEDVTLAMSALFMGYPVKRSDQLDALSYVDYLCNWFADKKQTACLAITLPSKAAMCLVFVKDGNFVGTFYVEDQTYSTDRNYLNNLLQADPQANIETSILPPEMTSSAVRFGFSISMARKAQY